MKHLILALLALASISGCASNPSNGPVYDPLEGVNRSVYKFNDTVDKAILKPVAKGYRYITPDFIEVGITNFFSNLNDITVIINDLLQGKFRQAGADTVRFFLNTTAGFLGFIDVSTSAGFPKHNESFGQTLGVWGIGEGPFVMLPILGPNNFRTTTAWPVDRLVFDIRNYVIDEQAVANALTALDIIALRARLLSAGNLLDSAALDPYLMFRDFWIQNHRRDTCDRECDSRPGTASSADDIDELDELDALDDIDELDELDELDALDELDELDELDALDALDELDELDELDALDALDKQDVIN